MGLNAKITGRAEIRRRLALFPSPSRQQASVSIQRVLTERPEWESAKVVGLYLSLPDEPETRDLIRLSWEQGKTVALPKTDIQHGLTWWEILPGPLTTFETLWEPLPGRHTAIQPETIEGFCVPGRAFDFRGVRLGRGGGHYDRALVRRSRAAWMVGVFFAIQEMENLPREAHDVTLPAVVTEQGWRKLS